ncbi:hypothetical protein CAter282_4441 [Collimonas arenae]|uniref:Uncharacterized protein n=1 Tax=Collimonas arenae TaxID=279058 RepID=A0A127QPV5_9BURK|nr:hypothetical protein CAter10_4825 [Collimonas arenae]AMP12101.1 hypothetical protein CAter282_4441 [Collimonas arenae]
MPGINAEIRKFPTPAAFPLRPEYVWYTIADPFFVCEVFECLSLVA